MKNVAATSGQRVNFADFFLADEMRREGKFAGTDMLLNLYRRPPKRASLSTLPAFFNEFAIEEYSVCARVQEQNESAGEFSYVYKHCCTWPGGNKSGGSAGKLADCARISPAQSQAHWANTVFKLGE